MLQKGPISRALKKSRESFTDRKLRLSSFVRVRTFYIDFIRHFVSLVAHRPSFSAITFFPISKPQSTDLPEKSKKICPLL